MHGKCNSDGRNPKLTHILSWLLQDPQLWHTLLQNKAVNCWGGVQVSHPRSFLLGNGLTMVPLPGKGKLFFESYNIAGPRFILIEPLQRGWYNVRAWCVLGLIPQRYRAFEHLASNVHVYWSSYNQLQSPSSQLFLVTTSCTWRFVDSSPPPHSLSPLCIHIGGWTVSVCFPKGRVQEECHGWYICPPFVDIIPLAYLVWACISLVPLQLEEWSCHSLFEIRVPKQSIYAES